MTMQATIRDARTIDDKVTVDVTNDQGQSTSFTLEELQPESPTGSPAVVSSYSGSTMNLGSDDFRTESWKIARAKAIEEGLILSEGE